MVRPSEGGGLFIVGWLLALRCVGAGAQLDPDYGCPPQERILPCRCSTRDLEVQIWCSHSELPKVLEGLKAVSHYMDRPVDELILENNNLPSLPGKVFATLRVLRLMLRHNRLERVSSGWLEGLHDSLLELFIVEPELRSLPVDSLEHLQGLEAVTLQSRVMKRLPRFSGLSKLRYLQINSPALLELAPRNFRDLPSLEELHVFGSPRLFRLEAGLFRDLPRLELINITDSGIRWIHPRAMINLPQLNEISLAGNAIIDAGMVGRACMDLPSLSVIRLDRNRVSRLGEGSFVKLPVLSRLYISRNYITEIFAAAFQGLPSLKSVDLNHNLIHRIHPDFFPQLAGNSLEEMWLINNDLSHVAEIRSVLEALPRLKFLDASYNQIKEIPFGSLRGHPTLERLHLNHNGLALLQKETFTAMPALRELRLKNNSLLHLQEAPFWNLPALKGLDLSDNYFRHIDPRLLTNLPNLRRLDLSGNEIGEIEPESFLGVPALEHINVSGNALAFIHSSTFRHLANLYELDVSWNRMLEVVPGLPKDIEHLHLSKNRIVILPSVSSQDLALPVLRSLDLSSNGIEEIPPGALAGLPNLRKLNLGYNSLRLLDDGVFDGLSRLEQLDLRYNRLVTLHGRSFRPLKSLMDVNLRGNRVEVLRPDIFQGNTQLQRVDLSRNNLAQIPHATFANNKQLRELYASYNTLTELPGSLHGLTGLRVLDLSFNKLNILSPKTLSSLSSLLELKLVRNRIRELREGAFDGLPRLSLIDLENNDLRVIERNAIRALPELQAVRLGRNRLQFIPSGAFTELPLLQSAELQENRIQEIAPNAFINVPHLLFLNLSHNHLPGLEYVGLESLRSLEVLDLSYNQLSRVSSDNLAAMEWLVELKMDNNRICAVHGSPFDDMPRLRVLSLRSNRMTAVSENAFKRLRSNIAILDIDENPLSCSCGMLWLRGWLQQASSEGPRCADGSLFKELRLSRQDCQRERYVEPVHPGCEAEMVHVATPSVSSSAHGVTETVPLWMNLKDSSTQRPSVSQDSDYVYEYVDYQDNRSDISSLPTSPPGGEVSTISVPTQTVKIIQPPPQQVQKTGTSPVKKNPLIPPSPSTSGFTFFGVPLPSLNFNLWGHSGRKAERKESPSSSSSSSSSPDRPGRGRYRSFPPTEPEIHRGGFVPLPRGQSGFVPIADPRLTYEKQAKQENNTSRSSNASSTSSHQERPRKSGNSTVTKVEKAIPRIGKPASRTGFREKEELSTSTLDRPIGSNTFESRKISPSNNKTSFNMSRVTKTVSEPIIVVEESSQEAHETSVSTEIYDGESLEMHREGIKFIEKPQMEVASRIILTTPKMIISTEKVISTRKPVIIKEIATAPSRDSDTKDLELEIAEYESDSVGLSGTTDSYVERDNPQATQTSAHFSTSAAMSSTSISLPREITTAISHTSRGTETSALSALLLAPDGQISSSPPVNIRPLGRSTITKVPSPHLNHEQREQSRQKQNKSVAGAQKSVEEIADETTLESQNDAFVLDEEAKVIDDNPYNWYFQHYNDTNLEPYIGVAYSGAAGIDTCRWLCLLAFSIFI